MKIGVEGKNFISSNGKAESIQTKIPVTRATHDAEVLEPYTLYKPIPEVPKAQLIQAEKTLRSLS